MFQCFFVSRIKPPWAKYKDFQWISGGLSFPAAKIFPATRRGSNRFPIFFISAAKHLKTLSRSAQHVCHILGSRSQKHIGHLTCFQWISRLFPCLADKHSRQPQKVFHRFPDLIRFPRPGNPKSPPGFPTCFFVFHNSKDSMGFQMFFVFRSQNISSHLKGFQWIYGCFSFPITRD